jgi:hypothetical protein
MTEVKCKLGEKCRNKSLIEKLKNQISTITATAEKLEKEKDAVLENYIKAKSQNLALKEENEKLIKDTENFATLKQWSVNAKKENMIMLDELQKYKKGMPNYNGLLEWKKDAMERFDKIKLSYTELLNDREKCMSELVKQKQTNLDLQEKVVSCSGFIPPEFHVEAPHPKAVRRKFVGETIVATAEQIPVLKEHILNAYEEGYAAAIAIARVKFTDEFDVSIRTAVRDYVMVFGLDPFNHLNNSTKFIREVAQACVNRLPLNIREAGPTKIDCGTQASLSQNSIFTQLELLATKEKPKKTPDLSIVPKAFLIFGLIKSVRVIIILRHKLKEANKLVALNNNAKMIPLGEEVKSILAARAFYKWKSLCLKASLQRQVLLKRELKVVSENLETEIARNEELNKIIETSRSILRWERKLLSYQHQKALQGQEAGILAARNLRAAEATYALKYLDLDAVIKSQDTKIKKIEADKKDLEGQVTDLTLKLDRFKNEENKRHYITLEKWQKAEERYLTSENVAKEKQAQNEFLIEKNSQLEKRISDTQQFLLGNLLPKAEAEPLPLKRKDDDEDQPAVPVEANGRIAEEIAPILEKLQIVQDQVHQLRIEANQQRNTNPNPNTSLFDSASLMSDIAAVKEIANQAKVDRYLLTDTFKRKAEAAIKLVADDTDNYIRKKWELNAKKKDLRIIARALDSKLRNEAPKYKSRADMRKVDSFLKAAEPNDLEEEVLIKGKEVGTVVEPSKNMTPRSVQQDAADVVDSLSTDKKVKKETTSLQLGPRQIRAAWENELKNSVYHHYIEEWSKKDYLSPLKAMPFSEFMTELEWQMQKNFNTRIFFRAKRQL